MLSAKQLAVLRGHSESDGPNRLGLRRVGEEHLPLHGADRENREAAVVRWA